MAQKIMEGSVGSAVSYRSRRCGTYLRRLLRHSVGEEDLAEMSPKTLRDLSGVAAVSHHFRMTLSQGPVGFIGVV